MASAFEEKSYSLGSWQTLDFVTVLRKSINLHFKIPPPFNRQATYGTCSKDVLLRREMIL